MSDGMLDETRTNLAQLGHSFTYSQADAQELPFHDASFDAVIANHMLYHVPDIPRALKEVRRVLKPSGFCYAATMGLANMREMDELAARFFSIPRMTESAAKFGLESGEAYMRARLRGGQARTLPRLAGDYRSRAVDGLHLLDARANQNHRRADRRTTRARRERNRDLRRNPDDARMRGCSSRGAKSVRIRNPRRRLRDLGRALASLASSGHNIARHARFSQNDDQCSQLGAGSDRQPSLLGQSVRAALISTESTG